tara:strand:- start:2146 stop:2316 length:171 start_codon:yes stop_codon:yes gene_type:complete
MLPWVLFSSAFPRELPREFTTSLSPDEVDRRHAGPAIVAIFDCRIKHSRLWRIFGS